VNTIDTFAAPQPVWERLMHETRYGKYADRVESSMVAHVLARCPEPGVLLDVGCEGGRRSVAFANRGWHIVATDIDAKSLQTCQSRIPKAECALADPNSKTLPAVDESIDAALCIEVGPVIHTAWAAQEFARVLKSGGRLAGVCWNRSSWRGVLYHKAPFLRSSGSHPLVGYPIKYSSFRASMVGHGFRFEKELGYAWVPFRRTSNSRFVTLGAAIERVTGLQHVISIAPIVAFVCQKLPISVNPSVPRPA
jgi:SAM-dependent methyltransferase